jgi:predicted Zn finger-like uncharacterized protein
MKITCPECSAAYDVPLSLATPGRRMRCANCGHVWVQGPPEEPSGAFGSFRPAPDDLIEPIPMSVHPQDVRDDEEDGGPGFFADVKWGALGRMVAGFALGFVIIYGLLFAMLAMGALPSALKPLAVAMGMNAGASLEGLELQDVTAKSDGKSTTVTGRLFNGADVARVIPMIEVVPITPDGGEGEGKRIKPEQDRLKPSEIVEFKADMGVLEPGTNVRVRLLGE